MITTATIELKKATPDDLKELSHWKILSGGERVRVEKLKQGQVFKVKSLETGKFDNQFYMINEDTDAEEIAFWLKNEMIYIPTEGIN